MVTARLPMKPGRAGTTTNDYKRHGTTTDFAALDVLDGARCTCNRLGENVMHRYEQVDHPSNKAVTLALGTNGGRDRGEVTGPTKIILGQHMVACTPQPGSLTPTKAFAMAEKLADHTGLPLVVIDPNGIWNPVWGELYRSTGPALAA